MKHILDTKLELNNDTLFDLYDDIYNLSYAKIALEKIQADIQGISDAMSAGRKGYTTKYFGNRYFEFWSTESLKKFQKTKKYRYYDRKLRDARWSKENEIDSLEAIIVSHFKTLQNKIDFLELVDKVYRKHLGNADKTRKKLKVADEEISETRKESTVVS
tara:strand:+ start:19 stop:498 length:480 start_codon:yes stop_codon:yes gene_type:complete